MKKTPYFSSILDSDAFWYFLLFIFLFFITVPSRLVFENHSEINFNIQIEIIKYCSLAICFSLISFFLLFSVFQGRNKVLILIQQVFFTLSLFIIFQQSFVPLKMPELATGDEAPIVSQGDVMIEMVIFCCLIVISLFFRKKTSSNFPKLIILCLIFSLLIDLFTVFMEFGEKKPARKDLADNRAAAYEEVLPNVYHFVFDEFQSEFLLKNRPIEEMSANFPGFNFYENARSNYLSTALSFPSFLTGSVYSAGQISLKEWQTGRSENLFNDFSDLGYTTHAYGLFPYLGYSEADIGFYEIPVNLWLYLDLWVLNLAPAALKKDVFADGKGVFSRWFVAADAYAGDLRTYHSSLQVGQLFRDELERPATGQYVFAHIFLPHAPYQLDSSGDYTSRGSSYETQLDLAVEWMKRFNEVLRTAHKYSRSVIVYQSDHGALFLGDETSELDDQLSGSIQERDPMRYSGRALDSRFQALLMAKGPHSTESFEVRSDLVQLKDLKEAILSAVTSSSADISFTLPAVDEVLMFHGLKKQYMSDGQVGRVCRHILSGTYAVYATSLEKPFERRGSAQFDCERKVIKQ